VLPAGCCGLLGVGPVPGWFWGPGVPVVPGVPGVVGPAWFAESGLRPLGVEVLGVLLLFGVEVRSEPPPVEVEGVVGGVLVEGDALLGGGD
jgi:hypothetical protein